MTELGAKVKVFRNDEIEISEIEKMAPDKLVVSGPSNPENAGISEELIKKMAPIIPILGVCLGHQCIGSTYGAKVGYAREVKSMEKSPKLPMTEKVYLKILKILLKL